MTRSTPARLTRHAVEAYHIFYPGASEDQVSAELSQALSVPSAIALKMVGRRGPHPRSEGSYRLHRERTGIFVLSKDEVVITFLRFYSWRQYQLACRLYPGDIPEPTCSSRWVDQARAERKQTREGSAGAPRDLHIAGAPASVVRVTKGVANLFESRNEARRFMAAAEKLHSTASLTVDAPDGQPVQPEVAFRRGSATIGVYRYGGRLTARLYSGPKPDKLQPKPSSAERARVIPVLGIPLRDLFVSEETINTLYGELRGGTRQRARWEIRRAVRRAMADGSYTRSDGRSQLSYRFPSQGRTIWVRSAAWKRGEGSWQATLLEPPELPEDQVDMANQLRRAGWTVYPPEVAQ